MRFYHEYFDKIGYSLFTGGLVTLVTTDESVISGGLIVIGFTCMIISAVNKKKCDNFEELIRQKLN
jgi:hypothetical protein